MGRTLSARLAGAPGLEAPGDARHSLEGKRASWAMGESAASAHLWNRRAVWRGPAEVCRRECSLRSIAWGSACVLGQQVERGAQLVAVGGAQWRTNTLSCSSSALQLSWSTVFACAAWHQNFLCTDVALQRVT